MREIDIFGGILSDLNEAKKQAQEELDDHRETINSNTNEIQSNYAFLMELDGKLEKLHERLDEISMILKQNGMLPDAKRVSYTIQPLTRREKEVFFALYTLEENTSVVTYRDLARKLGLSETLVASYITNLIEKGIPIVKKYANSIASLRLDTDFRQVQTKENLVGVTEVTSEKVMLVR